MAVTKIHLEKQQDIDDEDLKRRLRATRTGIRPSPYIQRLIDFYNKNNWASGYVGGGPPNMVYVPTVQDVSMGGIPQTETTYVPTEWNKLTPEQQQAWYTQSRNRLQYAPGENPFAINSYTGQFGVNPAYFSQDTATRNAQINALNQMKNPTAYDTAYQKAKGSEMQAWQKSGLDPAAFEAYASANARAKLAGEHLKAMNQIQQNWMLAQMNAEGSPYKTGWTEEAYMADKFGLVKDEKGNYKRRGNGAYGGGGGNSGDPLDIGGAVGGAAGPGWGYVYMPNFKNAFTVGIPNWFFGLPTSSAELSKYATALGYQISSLPAETLAWLGDKDANTPQGRYTKNLSEFFPTQNIPYESYIKGERPDVAYGEVDTLVGGGGTGITYQGGYGMSNRMPSPISAQMLKRQQQALLGGTGTSVLPALSQYIEQNYGLPWDTYLNYVSEANWAKPATRPQMRAFNQR